MVTESIDLARWRKSAINIEEKDGSVREGGQVEMWVIANKQRLTKLGSLLDHFCQSGDECMALSLCKCAP